MMRVPFALALLLCILTACSATQETETAPADTTAVPTGRWDETDAQTVAGEMIGDMLQGKWLQLWTEDHDGRPTVTVGIIENKTFHHIDEASFIERIERSLVYSDTVQFAAGEKMREKIRKTVSSGRASQCGRVNEPKEVVSLAQETGADLVIWGTIQSTVKEELESDKEIDPLTVLEEELEDDKQVVLYTVNLELLYVEENTKFWLQEKEIKKIIDLQQGLSSPRSPEDGNRATTGMSQGC